MLRQIANRLRGRQPTHLVLADDGLELHRAKLYAGYKADRPPKPQGLIDVETTLRNMFVEVGVAPFRVRGLEGDDVLHAAVLLKLDHPV